MVIMRRRIITISITPPSDTPTAKPMTLVGIVRVVVLIVGGVTVYSGSGYGWCHCSGSGSYGWITCGRIVVLQNISQAVPFQPLAQ